MVKNLSAANFSGILARDTVLIATPIDLRRVCDIRHDTCRITYELDELGKPDMKDVLSKLPKKGCCSCS